MKPKKLPRPFYRRPAEIVAKDMLGKYIIVNKGKSRREGKIIETEAYIGPQDKASHAYKGKRTSRNKVEFLEGGYIYIYLVYGIHWQLNIVTGKAGDPQCVLIRALGSNPKNLASGPGKLCRYLGLNKSFYGEDVAGGKKFWMEDRGEKIKKKDIASAKRIGIDYAGPYWAKRKLRFFLKGN